MVRQTERQPEPGRAPRRGTSAAADVQRWMRPRPGAGADPVLGIAAGPYGEHPLEQAVHQRTTPPEIRSEGVVFDRAITEADSRVQAAAAHVVDERDVFGEPHR